MRNNKQIGYRRSFVYNGSMTIAENTRKLLAEVPPHVTVEAAAKTRTPEEVTQVIEAGISIIGENYVQEAEAAKPQVTRAAAWHCIGSLQKNKVKKAVQLFDMIETVDSLELAAEIDKRSAQASKVMPVLIEVNSGRETQKSGVLPEKAEELVRNVAGLASVSIRGLMTMGPVGCGSGAYRECFRETKQLFDYLKTLSLPGVSMEVLSMGMTDSYREAIEEGATMIRIGSLIFGARG